MTYASLELFGLVLCFVLSILNYDVGYLKVGLLVICMVRSQWWWYRVSCVLPSILRPIYIIFWQVRREILLRLAFPSFYYNLDLIN